MIRVKIITTSNEVLLDIDTNSVSIHQGEYIVLKKQNYIVYCIVKNLDDNSIIIYVELVDEADAKILEKLEWIFGK